MKPPLIAACLWVLAATVTALLPRRRQVPPGIVLLILAPALLIWIGVAHGPWIAALGLAGVVSMFRRPLAHFARRALGRPEREDRA